MMNKLSCQNCNDMATWLYMPSGKYYFCDSCVPRGCSCNFYYEDWDENKYPKEYLDDLGRELPCVEYEFNLEGYENSL